MFIYAPEFEQKSLTIMVSNTGFLLIARKTWLQYLFIFATYSIVAAASPHVVLYSEKEFKGTTFELSLLNNVGDCQEFWNPWGGVDLEMQRYNGRARSMQLQDGVCVRLYDHDCAWTSKGKTADAFPDSTWLSSFEKIGMAGIVSAVERINCHGNPTPSATLYSGNHYQGEKLNLYGLEYLGDCIELYNSAGHNVKISEDLRRFNDKANSIKLTPGLCLRLSEVQCGERGKILDVRPNSQFSRNFVKSDFSNMLSSVTVINCPAPSGVTIFSSNHFQGDNINLSGLQEVGDCVELWSPSGNLGIVSQDLRKFNDKIRSILVAPGLCVRLYENHCGGNGRMLDDVRFVSSFAKDLGRNNFGGIVSAIELTCKN